MIAICVVTMHQKKTTILWGLESCVTHRADDLLDGTKATLRCLCLNVIFNRRKCPH